MQLLSHNIVTLGIYVALASLQFIKHLNASFTHIQYLLLSEVYYTSLEPQLAFITMNLNFLYFAMGVKETNGKAMYVLLQVPLYIQVLHD